MTTIQFFGKVIRTRMQRRAVVVSMYSSFVATVGIGVIANAAHVKWLAALEVPLGAVCLLGFYALSQMTKRYALQEDCRKYQIADERQAQVRDQAMARAYLLTSLILMAGVLWMAFAADSPNWWKPATWNEWQPIFWGVMLLTSTLPQAMIAWQEPDDIEDDLQFDRQPS